MDLQGMPDDERYVLLEELAEWLFDACTLFGMGKDAEDATNSALEKLIERWDTIKAPRGEISLKAWLEKTAIRAYWRRIAKEKRDRTRSLQESPKEDEPTREEMESDSSEPTFYDLALVRDEDVRLVRRVMAEMPEQCQLEQQHDCPPCDGGCVILWNRYGRQEGKVVLQELADDFGVSIGKLYPWFKRCRAHFKKLYDRES